MKKYGRGKLQAAMLEACATAHRTKELAATLGISVSNASQCLRVLSKRGDVKAIEGMWIATSVADAAWKRARIAAGEEPSAPAVIFDADVAEARSSKAKRAVLTARTKSDVIAALRALLESILADRAALLTSIRLLEESGE